MKIIQAFKEWRAARNLTKRTAKQELQAFVDYAATERHEYANAISIPHASVKAALNIDALAERDLASFPMELFTKVTPLVPPDLTINYTHNIHHYPAIEGSRSSSSKIAASARISFSLTPRVGGIHPSMAANPRSAILAFCYYERNLPWHLGLEKFPLSIRRYVRSSTPTINAQFAAAIHDGFVDTPTTRITSFAGFNNTQTFHTTGLAQPTRVLLLGHLDASAETIAVRRIIVDGKQMELTRDNLTLALAYAQQLTTQIFNGTRYNPAEAMQRARATQSTQRFPRWSSPQR